MRFITLNRPALGKAGSTRRISPGRSSSKLRYLLPLVLIVALAVPAGASAHRLSLTKLVNKVGQVAQARVDESKGWEHYKIQERSCFVSKGNRLHRHWGACEVRFNRADQHPCEYQIRLRLKSRKYRFVAPKYRNLQPWDYTCPDEP